MERRWGRKPFGERALTSPSPSPLPWRLLLSFSVPSSLPALVFRESLALSRKVTMEYPLMGDFPKKGIRLCWNPAVALSPCEKNPFCLKSGNQARCCVRCDREQRTPLSPSSMVPSFPIG